MPPRSSVAIVSDPDDDPDLFRRFDRRSDPATGVVVVRPVPGVRDSRQLASDMLVGFGKHYDALARERQLRNHWQAVQLWAKAERVRHLVVWDAERLPPGLWKRLAALAAMARHQLWLVVHDQPGFAQLAAVEGARWRRAAEIGASLRIEEQTIVGRPGEPWPLPRDSFFTFRAACRRRLSWEQFAEVDAVYLHAYAKTSHWLALRSLRQPPPVNQVIDQLRDLVVDSEAREQTLVRLRAAQAAYFQIGLLVQLTELSTPASFDVPITGVTPRVTARLRRLVTPAWPCALTAVMAGLSVKAVANLCVRDAAPDGAHLTSQGRTIPIPDHATAFIRAQLIARRHADAGAKDPLLVTTTGVRHDPGKLRLRLDSARQLAALWPLTDRPTPLWQHPTPAGLNVTLVPLAPRWRPAAP